LVHNLSTILNEELNVNVSCPLRAVGFQEGDHVSYPTLEADLQRLLKLWHHPRHLLLRDLLPCEFRGSLFALSSLSDDLILNLVDTNIFLKWGHPRELMKISVLVYIVAKISQTIWKLPTKVFLKFS
jgi:hypothetical protein